jgi:hypothetical protein
MEFLIVTFGDSYERAVVGMARDLTEARTVAEAYRARFSFPGWFEFERFVPGEVGSRAPAEELDLVHNLG